MDLCLLSITFGYHTIPYANHNTTTLATRCTTLTSTNLLPMSHLMTSSALCSENQDSSMKRTPLQSARHQLMCVFSHWLYEDDLQSGRECSWGPARQGASLRWFLTLGYAALWGAALRWFCMCRSWTGVVTVVMPNSLKHLWRRCVVEKWAFSSLATALVDILAVSTHTHSTLATSVDLCCAI